MNAEALIGTVLGTCTLQRLIGQGGMGAVYLAQQSRPRRQVAVKVLLPMTPLSANQLAAFLERFRRETDAAASLEHPNIMPVHEYGERDGLAYLVMPYISGGTLRDLLEREGQLSLEKVVNFLDQLAAALDCAHEHGVVHRDIKPANILLTPEGRLLLTDFGLVKIIAEGQMSQMRLTGPGAPVGTPDYMAPEQVIGEDVDTRADLYSLGVILYQMVTGTTPFQGDTPMQIAAQHLQLPPPSPQMLRPDLPIASEQVILRALSKRPSERYARAQDMANAFRSTLVGTGISLNINTASMPVIPPSGSTGRIFIPKGTFGTPKSTTVLPAMDKPAAQLNQPAYNAMAASMEAEKQETPNDGMGLLSRARMSTSAMQALEAADARSDPPQGGSGLLSRTGRFPLVGTGTTGQFSAVRAATGQMPSVLETSANTLPRTTGQQPVLTNAEANAASTVKLTGPVKVVQVPVAGQPGKYVTGILPVPQVERISPGGEPGRQASPWVKWVSLAVALALLLGAVSGFVVLRPQLMKMIAGNGQPQPGSTAVQQGSAGTPNPAGTASAQASATVQANVIVTDPLDHNTNGAWPENQTDLSAYAFKDGAYHITVLSDKNGASAILPNYVSEPGQAAVYTLTMQEIKGNDGSASNTFGMIFRANQQMSGGKITAFTFYSFEVENTKNANYHVWKYDSERAGADAWQELWHGPIGNEFHQGQGANAINTFKVFMNKDTFTFSVNGKMLNGKAQDGAYTSGKVGMMVNMKGTEVAFKNLTITRS